MQPGEVVSVDQLIDAVWGASPPSPATATLQSHVSYLRRLLGPDASIGWRAPGYVLDAGADGTDVLVAERLIRAGSETDDPADGVTLLRQAIGVWRGQALADVAGQPWFDVQVRRLDALLLRARRALADRYLRLGRYSEAIAELEDCLRQSPLDEDLHERLMLALYRSGRQADALAGYQQLRALLDQELGVVPGRAVRELHGSILRHDAALDPPEPDASATAPAPAVKATATGTVTVTVPAQLPAPLPELAGREPELQHLDELLDQAGAGSRTRVVTVICGMAGVGKTTLATLWANRVADRFPDGQLYVNLRGFDPGRPPMDPADAIRGFLIALGVSAPLLPADLDSRTALYRTLLAGRRVLILLDSARDAAQVRPLLPGRSASTVIITSRDDLRPLVATDGAHPLGLSLLTHDEGHDLLAHRLGMDRLAAEPEAVAEIIDRCARLPLALAVVAAAAASRPRFPLAAIADDLQGADGGGPLNTLDGGDASTGVRAVFARSYDCLTPAAARTFRLFALHPGPDISTVAAASLAGLSRERTRADLAELTRAHLLVQDAPGRWAFHDLLRAYAAEQARIHDSRDHRSAAVRRMLDHYLHAARAAVRTVYGDTGGPALPPAAPDVQPEDLADEAHARTWLTAEHQVLLAMVECAHANGDHTHVWHLATTLTADLCYRWYDWNALATIHELALDATQTAADALGQAHAHYGIGLAQMSLGQTDAAERQLRTALDLFGDLGETAGQGRASHCLGWARHQAGAPDEALRLYQDALTAFRNAEEPGSQAITLNNISELHAESGRPQQALDIARQALALIEGRGARQKEAAIWDTRGHAHHLLGESRPAIACYTRAVDLYTEVGNELYTAETLLRAGDTHQSAGDHQAARRARQQALAILERLDHPDAAAVRAKLRP
jgi:DNA-binding SARP family transcriptional activator